MKAPDAAVPHVYTESEQQEREHQSMRRMFELTRARAGVVRSKVTQAFDLIDIEHALELSDTAFRDKFARVRRELASILNDYLLSDTYWEKRIKAHQDMSPAEYAASLNGPAAVKKKQ